MQQVAARAELESEQYIGSRIAPKPQVYSLFAAWFQTDSGRAFSMAADEGAGSEVASNATSDTSGEGAPQRSDSQAPKSCR